MLKTVYANIEGIVNALMFNCIFNWIYL